jgi:hypothetical protein
MAERTSTRTTIECDGCDLAIEVAGKLEAEFKGAGTRPLGTSPGPWFTVRIDARTEEAYKVHSDLRGVDRIYCEGCVQDVVKALDDLKARGQLAESTGN